MSSLPLLLKSVTETIPRPAARQQPSPRAQLASKGETPLTPALPGDTVANRSRWSPRAPSAPTTFRWVAIKYRSSLIVDRADKPELSHLRADTCGNSALAVPPLGR